MPHLDEEERQHLFALADAVRSPPQLSDVDGILAPTRVLEQLNAFHAAFDGRLSPSNRWPPNNQDEPAS
ncbi:hypothetical protein ACFYZ5_45915 [Streptomyces chartreusis]|uniref:hypothetical protein n=1 Tax=Streptomyces chartreusis TaxID=1969 RepID=UPI0036AFDD2C